MPDIKRLKCDESIECYPGLSDGNAYWMRHATYSLIPSDDEIATDQDEAGKKSVVLARDATLRLPFASEENLESVEGTVKYSLNPGRRVGQRVEREIPEDDIRRCELQLANIFPFDVLEKWFENYLDFRFEFQLTLREALNLGSEDDNGPIIIVTEETETRRTIKVRNSFASSYECDGPILNDYPVRIGNLSREIVWTADAFIGSRQKSFSIELEGAQRLFTRSEYEGLVASALRTESVPLLRRIPSYISKQYPQIQPSLFPDLSVFLRLEQVEPGAEYRIEVDLRNRTNEVVYSTGIEVLDECIRDIYFQLLDRGVPYGQTSETFQKVIRELLLYRHYCACRRDYITEDVAAKNEVSGFHAHLNSRLGHSGFDMQVISEPEIGNSRLDLLIEGIPAELKLENRVTATTADTIERYKLQAADYVARQSSRFGFLMVLDTVLSRELPTSAVNQDVRLVEVRNVSGETVSVIVIIVRIPQRASDLTTQHKARKRQGDS